MTDLPTPNEALLDGGDGALAPTSEPSNAELLEILEALQDLFKRRLLQDRQKQEMFDKLYVELEAARKAVDEVQSLPMIRDLLLVVDRFDRYEGADLEFVDHAAQELLELLHRQGVDPLHVEVGAAFDPSYHEIVETRIVDDAEWHNLVIDIVRKGYRAGDRVLRPTHVVIAVAERFDDDVELA